MEGADDSIEERFYDENGLNVGVGVACLWHYLMRRDLSGFSHKRPIENESRREMIRTSQTDVEEMFLDLMKSPPQELMSRDEIIAYLDVEKDDVSGGSYGLTAGLNDSEKRQIKKLCQHHLTPQQQVKITFKLDKDGVTKVKRDKVWKVRPLSFIRNKIFTSDEMRAIYELR